MNRWYGSNCDASTYMSRNLPRVTSQCFYKRVPRRSNQTEALLSYHFTLIQKQYTISNIVVPSGVTAGEGVPASSRKQAPARTTSPPCEVQCRLLSTFISKQCMTIRDFSWAKTEAMKLVVGVVHTCVTWNGARTLDAHCHKLMEYDDTQIC